MLKKSFTGLFLLSRANGDVVVASEDSHPDLFHGLPCSYGTIGIITRIQIKLVPTTQTVQLDYIRVANYEDTLALISSAAKTSAEFIDAIMFAPNRGMVMVGTFTSDAQLPLKPDTKSELAPNHLQTDLVINVGA